MSSTKCEREHNFVAEKVKRQEYVHKYSGADKPYDKAILDVEYIILFCTRCGKNIEVKEENENSET